MTRHLVGEMIWGGSAKGGPIILKTLRHRVFRKLATPARLFLSHARAGPSIFAERHLITNAAQVTLYTDDDNIFPDYTPRESLCKHLGKRTRPISLIVPVKNEVTNVGQWWEQITRQTRLPDEIIVVDAGSTDGTLEMLRRIAGQSHIPFQVIVEPGCNIARARNLATERARYPIIAAIDFGCLPQSDWLEKLVAPFEANCNTRVVAGMYVPINSQRRPQWRGFPIYPHLERIDPANFLPSNRSVAFRRDAWRAVGGYPEWLSLTGEDTWFDRELQRLGGEWAFVPEAIVEWHAPENFFAYCRKVFGWAQGDGESGLHANFYWRYLLQLIAAFGGILALFLIALVILASRVTPIALWLGFDALLWFAGVLFTSRIVGVSIPILFPEVILETIQLTGFLVGARKRPAALKRRLDALNGTIFILSGVPIDDTGGGARCAQIALEFLRQNFAVVFIHKFPKYENQDLDLKIGHPNLFHYALAEFKWEKFLRGEGQGLDEKLHAAILEFPLRDFLALANNIRQHHGIVVYDLLDAWDTSLGATWYSPQIEADVIAASQILIATAPSLVRHLEQQSNRPVTFLPNAVNPHLFNPNRAYVRPGDLPNAERIVLYTGALWGEWFDWELLVEIAEECPSAAVVVIGDYRGQSHNAPNNLFFLGLKPHDKLPAYLAHADVGIIPWKINAITNATSPLKVYEFLAMHKPVIAPAIPALRDLPGVWLARDAAEFMAHLDAARTTAFPTSQVDHFIAANHWQSRVEKLLTLIESARPGKGDNAHLP